MIVEMNSDNLKDINQANESFDVIGKIIPQYANDTWTYTEMLYDKPYRKQYANDDEDYSGYVDSPDKVVYFCYVGDECIGQIRIRKNWNKFAYVEDLAVSAKHRKQGVGSELIRKAVEWARKNDLHGLMLETQDNNLTACRFYRKCGFVIGAVDTMLYANYDVSHEKAVFWYLKVS